MTTLISGGNDCILAEFVDDCSIVNTVTGTISTQSSSTGGSGISLLGNSNSIRNAGLIEAANGAGVLMRGLGNVLDNSGMIFGGNGGLYADGDTYSIFNSGTIQSGNTGIGTYVFHPG
jgi:hypothetical protein